jgi:hypothetical protein
MSQTAQRGQGREGRRRPTRHVGTQQTGSNLSGRRRRCPTWRSGASTPSGTTSMAEALSRLPTNVPYRASRSSRRPRGEPNDRVVLVVRVPRPACTACRDDRHGEVFPAMRRAHHGHDVSEGSQILSHDRRTAAPYSLPRGGPARAADRRSLRASVFCAQVRCRGRAGRTGSSARTSAFVAQPSPASLGHCTRRLVRAPARGRRTRRA